MIDLCLDTTEGGRPAPSGPELERAERNRLKALALKRSRLMAHPYSGTGAKPHKPEQPKLVDSGGGFFIEEGGEEEEQRRVVHEDSGIQSQHLHPPFELSCINIYLNI